MELKLGRWEQVKILFEAAIKQRAEARAHFLEANCSDPEIRKEVARLIANEQEMGSFLSGHRESPRSSPQNESRAFAIGQRLTDRFKVIRFIARGGMGEVYEALDLELQTPVGIKAIRPDLLQNSKSLERLRKEVQLSREVTHPNVCRVYDLFRHSSGSDSPVFFISMEYLRGETLAERLRRVVQMNTREALPLVLQIVSALEAAHSVGILHRDLKPENIMLVPCEKSIRAVVMDFGVALRAEDALKDSTSTMLTGTPAYMSPEQIENGDLTPASDVYSLGLVIYRMVTGRQAFGGVTTTSAVLQRLSEAPTSPCELVSDLDHSWEIVIAKCLERNPARRYPSAQAVGLALDPQHSDFSDWPRGGFTAHAVAMTVVVLAVVSTVILLKSLQAPPKTAVEFTQERLTFNSSDRPVSSFALSGDSKYLAYADLAGIHVKLLSTGEERLIPKPKRASANASWEIASWFRDGTKILVHLGINVLDQAGGPAGTWTIPALGQSPQQLKDGAWGWEVSPDGARIAFSPLRSSAGDAREIWVMDDRGFNPRKLLSAKGNQWLNTVRWSPDGQRLAYLRVWRSPNTTTNSVETCDLYGANCAVVVPPEVGHWHNDFSWLPDERIIYTRQESPAAPVNDLWQRKIDSRSGRPISDPKRITHWEEAEAINLSASADGRHLAVLKQTSQGQIELGKLTLGGTHIDAPRRLVNDEAYGYPSDWTPDSAAVILTYSHNGRTTIMKQPITGQAAEPLATGLLDAYLPRISSDGKWIIYMTAHNADFTSQRLMRIPVNGGSSEFVLEVRNWIDHSCGHAPATCVVMERSQDRKSLKVTKFDPLTRRGELLRTIPNGSSDNYNYLHRAQALSVDGLTYAVATNGGEDTHVRLLSLSNKPDREIVIKGWVNTSGMDWAPDGKGLYCGFVSPRGRTLLYVNLKGTTQILRQYNAAGDGEVWGVPSPDGRYIAVLGGALSSNVWMLQGF